MIFAVKVVDYVHNIHMLLLAESRKPGCFMMYHYKAQYEACCSLWSSLPGLLEVGFL